MNEPDPYQRVQTVCLFILAVVAVAFSLFWLRGVMVPFVLSLFIALGLQPVVEFQTRKLHAPRAVAVIVTLVLAIGILGLL